MEIIRTASKQHKHENLYDLHIHTKNSPDSSALLEEILQIASGMINGLVITDHDYVSNFSEDLIRDYKEKYQITILAPAVEITTNQGDILAFGIEACPSKMLEPEEVIDIIHKDGGIAIAAHPFALKGIGDLIFDLDFDAIEINGLRNQFVNQKAKQAAELLDLPLIGGSDAHLPSSVGRCVTKFSTPIKNMSHLIEEIKKGNCSPIMLKPQ